MENTESKSQLSILIIEDHPDQRDLLAIVLQREGYKVVTAANGVEALEQLERFRPTVVTLDEQNGSAESGTATLMAEGDRAQVQREHEAAIVWLVTQLERGHVADYLVRLRRHGAAVPRHRRRALRG